MTEADRQPPPRFIWLSPAAAALLCLGSLALYWPGYVTYDAAGQYAQAVSGHYVDWHPPIMARLWSILLPIDNGQAPMFVLQMLFYWVGFGMIGAALAGNGRRWTALGIVAIGAFPLFVGWQAEVLKDAQLSAALLCAIGLIALPRLAGRPVPLVIWLIALILLTYATLLRGNAIFVVAPLLVALSARITLLRVGIAFAGIVATLLLMPAVNQRLLGAAPTTIARTLPIYDLAGILVHGGPGTGLLPAERRAIIEQDCYRPFFWDPLGHPARCGPALVRLRTEPLADLYGDWIVAIVTRPDAYVAHRIDHLNSTWRLAVPRRWLRSAPPVLNWRGPHLDNDGVDLHFNEPSRLAKRVQYRVAVLVETPLAWPIFWIVVGITCAFALRTASAGPVRTLAIALLASALTLEASFIGLSIASPLRYHLWPMMACALALLLTLSERAGTRRIWIAGLSVAMIVITIGITARLIRPPAAATFTGNL